MTNAAIQKRLSKLETEVKKLKDVVKHRPNLWVAEENRNAGKPIVKNARAKLLEKYGQKQKKGGLQPLPRWLHDSLKDVEEGKVSGPFNTVKELMAHLQK